MIGKIKEMLGIKRAEAKQEPVDQVEPAQSLANLTENEKTQLHNPIQKLPSREFHKVSLESPEIKASKNAQKILKWFKVGKNPENTAAISQDGKQLVLVSDGKTSFRRQFFNAWWYKPVYWFKRMIGSHHSDYGMNFYSKEVYADASYKDPDHVVRETEPHLRKALKTNDYKVVSIFLKNPKTGEYAKEASTICLLNNLKHLVKKSKKYSGKQTFKHIQEADQKNDFTRYYVVDRYIKNPHSQINEAEASHILAEAFYQAYGYDELHIQTPFLGDGLKHSDTLAYHSLPWTHVFQTNDKKWHETNPEQTAITIVRPESKAKQTVEPYVADLHVLSEIEEGRSFKTSKDGERFINTASDHNLRAIEKINQEINSISS